MGSPPGCHKEIEKLIMECWIIDPDNRKRPQAIVRDVNQILYEGKHLASLTVIYISKKDFTFNYRQTGRTINERKMQNKNYQFANFIFLRYNVQVMLKKKVYYLRTSFLKNDGTIIRKLFIYSS